jgi:hypothetical protein
MSDLVLKTATWPDIEAVARHMCERHARAACSRSCSDNPVEAISGLALRQFLGVTIWKGYDPVVAVGAAITHPNVASTFLYGVKGWESKARIATTRFLRKALVPSLCAAGVKRITVLAPAGDPTGERWKRYLGAQHEATLRKYGKNGEDFCLYTLFL